MAEKKGRLISFSSVMRIANSWGNVQFDPESSQRGREHEAAEKKKLEDEGENSRGTRIVGNIGETGISTSPDVADMHGDLVEMTEFKSRGEPKPADWLQAEIALAVVKSKGREGIITVEYSSGRKVVFDTNDLDADSLADLKKIVESTGQILDFHEDGKGSGNGAIAAGDQLRDSLGRTFNRGAIRISRQHPDI